MKPIILTLLLIVLTGCASGRLELYDAKGQMVGECTAGYDWHFYGAEASVDWLLNHCAEQALLEGNHFHSVSNQSILDKDYAYPNHPKDKPWDKKQAWIYFRSGYLTETHYGYILADIENVYYLKTVAAKQKLDSGLISKLEYEQLISAAKAACYGD